MGPLILICDHRDAERARAAVLELLHHWDGPPPKILPVAPQHLAELDPAPYVGNVAWVYAGADARWNLQAVLDTLDQWRCPTVLLRCDEQYPLGITMRDGLIVLGTQVQPQTLALILRTLLCPSQMIRDLAAERGVRPQKEIQSA